MKSTPTEFCSDQLRIDANFYHEDACLRDDAPVVVGCSGYTGLMNIHPERFARALTPRGHLCFGFDYRGFGKSEGTPRHVTTEEQARDITHAIDCQRCAKRVSKDRRWSSLTMPRKTTVVTYCARATKCMCRNRSMQKSWCSPLQAPWIGSGFRCFAND